MDETRETWARRKPGMQLHLISERVGSDIKAICGRVFYPHYKVGRLTEPEAQSMFRRDWKLKCAACAYIIHKEAGEL